MFNYMCKIVRDISESDIKHEPFTLRFEPMSVFLEKREVVQNTEKQQQLTTVQ